MSFMEKWSSLLDESKDKDKLREITSELLKRHAEALTAEIEKTPKTGDFMKFALPIIRARAPYLRADQLISVQPMTGPVGGITFYKPKPPKTPLLELTERIWAEEDETDDDAGQADDSADGR